MLFVVFFPLTALRNRARAASIRARLVDRGLAIVASARRGSITAAGMIAGVAVRVDVDAMTADDKRKRGKKGRWSNVTVHASRDPGLVLAGIDLQAPSASLGRSETDDATPPGVREELSPEEALASVRAALAEDLSEAVVERRGSSVEVWVPTKLIVATPIDRAIDAARAVVEQKPPPPARATRAAETFIDDVAVSGGLAVFAGFLIATIVPCCSAAVRDRLAPVCAPDPITLTVEEDDDGTGYTVECVDRTTRRTYGCFPVWAAAFDVTFPATLVAMLTMLSIRRLARRR
jgi:hypothetical protein